MERDPRIDSLKGVLIVLVVFGHLLAPFIRQSHSARMVCGVIYLFHMPLFVIVAGIFAKQTFGRGDVNKLLERILLPLAVFQVLYLSAVYIAKGSLTGPFWQPYWILWFLLSLAIWRLSLPLMLLLKAPLLMLTVTAVVAGYVDAIGYPLSLSRTIYFAPFFLFGFLHGHQAISWAASNRSVATVCFVIAIALTVIGSNVGMSHSLLYGSMGYSLTEPHFIEPGVQRVLVMALSLIAAISFAGLLPSNWKPSVYLGQRSLTVFLLHGFLVLLIGKLWSYFGVSSMLIILCAAVSITVAFVLAPLDRFVLACFAWLAYKLRKQL